MTRYHIFWNFAIVVAFFTGCNGSHDSPHAIAERYVGEGDVYLWNANHGYVIDLPTHFNQAMEIELDEEGKKELEKALEEYQKSVDREHGDPEFAQGYFRIGLVRLRQGQAAKAKDAFTDAIKRDKKYAKAYYFRGKAYQKLGDEESAQKDFDIAVELDGSLAQQAATS